MQARPVCGGAGATERLASPLGFGKVHDDALAGNGRTGGAKIAIAPIAQRADPGTFDEKAWPEQRSCGVWLDSVIHL